MPLAKLHSVHWLSAKAVKIKEGVIWDITNSGECLIMWLVMEGLECARSLKRKWVQMGEAQRFLKFWFHETRKHQFWRGSLKSGLWSCSLVCASQPLRLHPSYCRSDPWVEKIICSYTCDQSAFITESSLRYHWGIQPRWLPCSSYFRHWYPLTWSGSVDSTV